MHTVSLDVVALHAENPGPITGAGNWTYLLRGPHPLLVDAGVGMPQHLDAMAAATPAGPERVVVTHAHEDHAAGAPALAGRFPAARFAKLPWPERDQALPVRWEPLADGDVLDTGSGPLTVVHTPGHAPDHVVLWHAASRTAFTGDLLVLGGTVVVPASGGGRLTDYLASLRRLAALGPVRALPAHGPVIDDPLALVDAYLTHRRGREQQIVALLGAGASTPDAIAARLYPDLDPALGRMARESVLAHLVKLEDEARAQRNGGEWQLAG